jgi:hypothetical protein
MARLELRLAATTYQAAGMEGESWKLEAGSWKLGTGNWGLPP